MNNFEIFMIGLSCGAVIVMATQAILGTKRRSDNVIRRDPDYMIKLDKRAVYDESTPWNKRIYTRGGEWE